VPPQYTQVPHVLQTDTFVIAAMPGLDRRYAIRGTFVPTLLHDDIRALRLIRSAHNWPRLGTATESVVFSGKTGHAQ